MSLFQNFPLLFFILLIPLSGFIAWAGDRIGHRIGKRRHTFLGLRPRHTATFLTVVSGMVISLVSFGLMWASNETFRVVLSEGAALSGHNRRLRRENASLVERVSIQRSRVAALRSESNKAREEAAASRTAQQTALLAQKKAEAALTTAQGTLKAAENDLKAARNDLRTTRRDLDAKTRRVEEARKQVAIAQRLRDTAKNEADRAQKAADDAKKRLDASEKQLANAERTFKTVTEQQRNEIERQKEELTRITQNLEARRAELAALLVTNTGALRRNRITYEVNEELERTALSAGMSPGDIQMALWKLLRSAADRAAARGAAVSPEGRAVIILPKQVTDDKQGGMEIADESDSVAAAAESIHGASQDVAVMVVAAANAVEGEPVPVEFRTYRNRQVLKRNTVVGTITIDGTRPQPVIADTLYAFLKRDVRKRLLDAGVIPPAPATRGGVDAEESIVSISGDRWFQILDEVRRVGARAQVVVRVDSDTRAADPVVLAFEVNPARGVSSATP